jgi:glycosyltransferase involved in cell wall biosynthesis
VGGVPDVVRDGQDGILVDPADVHGLVSGLERLAREPELRERMGSAGHRRVVERYAVHRLIEETDLLYRSLLQAAAVG